VSKRKARLAAGFVRAKALDILAPSLALALRAVGYADVRSGILPPQSGYRFAIPG
jgi:hypothetical protein